MILDIVRHLNWSYIFGVYTDDNYGTNGFEYFKRYAEDSGICIFRTYVIRRKDSNIQSSLTNFIRSLFIDLEKTQDENVGGVYYGFSKEAITLYRTITERLSSWVLERDQVHKVHWVMSDGVGNSAELARQLQTYDNMVITVSPSSGQPSEIREHFASVVSSVNSPVTPNKWYPWMREYVEYLYKCSPQGSSSSVLPACPASLDLMTKFNFYDYVNAALDATYILADVVKRVHQSMHCSRHEECSAFLKQVNDGILPDYRPGPIRYSDFERGLVPDVFVKNMRELVVADDGDLFVANTPLYDINLAANGRFTKVYLYLDIALKLVFLNKHELTKFTKKEPTYMVFYVNTRL